MSRLVKGSKIRTEFGVVSACGKKLLLVEVP